MIFKKLSFAKILKYLGLAFLGAFVLSIAAATLTFKTISSVNNNSPEGGKTANSQENEPDDNDYFRTKPVFSPDGNILVFLEGGKFIREGNWGVRLRVSPWNNNSRIEDSSYVEGTTWLTDNKDGAFEYQNFFKVAWTRDGNRFAVFLPHKIIVRSFERSNEEHDDGFGGTFVSTVLKEVSFDEIALDGQFDTDFAPEVFYFSSSGEDLFFANDGKLFQVAPEKKIVYHVPSSQGEIYPLPTGNGFGYFSSSEPYGSYNLIIIKNTVESVFKTPIAGMDYAGDIIFSPDSTHLCAGLGASGHYGYTVFKIGEAHEVASGQQYSYCVKWLDNFRILVKNIPYFYQWSTQYYIIDVRTGVSQFVDNISMPPEDWEGLY